VPDISFDLVSGWTDVGGNAEVLDAFRSLRSIKRNTTTDEKRLEDFVPQLFLYIRAFTSRLLSMPRHFRIFPLFYFFILPPSMSTVI
jgi:hypothetical protein